MIEHILNDAKDTTNDERHRNIDSNSLNHQAPLTVTSSDPKATINRYKEDSGTTIILNSPTKQGTKQVPQSSSIKFKKPIRGDAGQYLAVSQAPSNNKKEPPNKDGEEGGSSINQGWMLKQV